MNTVQRDVGNFKGKLGELKDNVNDIKKEQTSRFDRLAALIGGISSRPDGDGPADRAQLHGPAVAAPNVTNISSQNRGFFGSNAPDVANGAGGSSTGLLAD
eukprot:3822380-Karenia_brevis.AAC.1